jgi:serine/threonine-protein kinase
MHHDPETEVGKRDDGTLQEPLPADVAALAQTKITNPESNPPAAAAADLATQAWGSKDKSGTGSKDSSDSEDRDGISRETSGVWAPGPPPVIAKGQVIFDKYLLLEKLGKGGMGQVWLVKNLELDTESALKLLNLENVHDNRAQRRFKREAKLMRQLKHPRAVSVYDARGSHSIFYIEMEFVRGRTLQEILDEHPGQPMPLEWIVPVLDQLCAVLQEAHGHVDEKTGTPQPIVHRDLKPSNLMVVDKQKEGQNLKVLDFGIAKLVDENQKHDQDLMITGPGEFTGTVAYCSPEQIKGGGGSGDDESSQALDGRSDIYSVGVILYQLLCGALPFRGGDMAVLSAHLMKVPDPPTKLNPRAMIPPEIERLVLQCLEKNPANRPQTALELAQRFHAAADRVLSRKRRKSRTRVLAALAVLGIAGAGLGVAAFPHISELVHDLRRQRDDGTIRPPPRPPPPSPPPSVWEPSGYKAVAGTKIVPGRRNEPQELIRTADKVRFVRYKEGVYLPIGYEPEDPSELVGDWPRAIIRVRDRETTRNPDEWVRFIRLKGKTFQCGDVRAAPLPDTDPVWVRVFDFYILETEVTNRVLEEYLRTYPEDKSKLEMWRQSVTASQANESRQAGLIAANGIGYLIARKCAGFLGGRLPTEAEWEYAAKSERDDSFWPWGTMVPKGRTMAHLEGPLRPFPVKKYTTDKSEQGVYGLTGNLREWCLDHYSPRPEIIPSNNSPDVPMVDQPWKSFAGQTRIEPSDLFVLKGGSFETDLDGAMVFLRDKRSAGTEDLFDVGFRVVIDFPGPPPAGSGN